MTERPILFQGAMVRALLSGTKTQTRRLVKPQPWASCSIHEGDEGESPFVYSALGGDGPGHDVTETRSPCRCPYGQPGDRLWVREAWGYFDPDNTGQTFEEKNDDCGNGPCKTYAPELMQDGHQLREYWRRRIAYRATWQDGAYGTGPDAPARWRPSIHMPRWASRILLEVTEVRVQRLQEISEEDARAEGCEQADNPDEDAYIAFGSYYQGYRRLWDSINGKTPGAAWRDDPWVWAVSFKVIRP